jgi:hypothetical protein
MKTNGREPPKGYRWLADVAVEPWWAYSRSHLTQLARNGALDAYAPKGKQAVVKIGLRLPGAKRDSRAIAIAVEAVNWLRLECLQSV